MTIHMNSNYDINDVKTGVMEILREGVVTVTFTKNDGSERTMRCTLAENKIPAEKLPKGTGKAENADVQAVFDVENDGWRSFRWDSVKSFSFTLE